MGLLDNVRGVKVRRPRRILLYGTSGIGKSTWAANAPNAIFIPTEDGLNDISCRAFFEDRPEKPYCQSYAEFRQCLAELYQDPRDYKTAVIDSLDWLETLVIAETCRQLNATSLEEKRFYGKGYENTLPIWIEVLSGLSALANERGMTVVCLAHYTTEKVRQPDIDTYTRYSPKLHKEASEKLREWCTELLFATYPIYTTTTDEGFNRERTRAAGTGERILKTTERPTHLAKNRLNLPDEIPFQWSEFAKYLPNDTTLAA